MSLEYSESLHCILLPKLKNRQGGISLLLRRPPVCTKFLLVVTLHILTGSSYLNVSWPYRVSLYTVDAYFIRFIV